MINVYFSNIFFSFRNGKNQDQEILVQVDLFEENLANDEEQIPKLVDLNVPLDVFHAVYKQVRLFYSTSFTPPPKYFKVIHGNIKLQIMGT